MQESQSLTPSERIRAIAKLYDLRVKNISDAMGMKRPQILYDIISGKTRNISPTVEAKLLEAFPEIDIKWLRSGQGNITGDDKMHETPQTYVQKLEDEVRFLRKLTMDLTEALKKQEPH